MANSWRIQTNIIDRSQVASIVQGTNGAMVVRASKGVSLPKLVNPGDTNRLISLIGEPSVDFPDVYEAIVYNAQNPLWVSAPFVDGDLLGGAVITNVGSLPIAAGVDPTDVAGYTFGTPTATVIETVGTGDGATVTFNKTLSVTPTTPSSSNFDIYIDGVDDNVTVGTLSSGAYPLTGGGLTTGSQYVVSSKVLTLVFSVAPVTGKEITVHYATASSPYFALFAISPYADDLGIQTTYDATTEQFSVDLYRRSAAGSQQLVDTYVFSLTVGAKNFQGQDIYIGTILQDNDYIQPLVNTDVIGTFLPDSSIVEFAEGARDTDSITTADLLTGWEYFKNSRTYTVKVFMSTVSDALIVTEFNTLRGSTPNTGYQKYSDYLFPLPQASVSSSINTKAGYSVSNRGIQFFWNRFLVDTQWGQFWSTSIGAIGLKYAAMSDVFFGLAPAGSDDESGHGGQLPGSYLKQAYDPSETEQQLLDQNGINAIVKDPFYGVTIMSDKTGQNPKNVSDTSYTPHSRLIDYIIENVIQSVLTPQTLKLNDQVHRNTALVKGLQITDPIVNSGILSEAKHKCDTGNNTAAALAKRQFVYSLAIKVTPFSETLQFNLILTSQGVSVNQVLV